MKPLSIVIILMLKLTEAIPLFLLEPTLIGDEEDENECCISCGYEYCPSLDTCIRRWETMCREFDFPYNVFYASGIVLPKDDYYDKGH